MSDTNDWNAQIIEEFRANGGKVGGMFEGATLVLLHTTGARSGQERINPLGTYHEGDRIYVFASKAGADTNPDWYHNVRANPEVSVELGTETFAARATVLDEPERTRVYEAQAALVPQFAAYQAGTSRVIPVVALDRVD